MVVTASVDPDATRSVEQNVEQSTVRIPRAGFVVSKAVGGAVVRNRVKRRLRAIMSQQLRRRLVADSGALIQVRALPAAAEADYATLEADVASALTQCLRRAGGERPRRHAATAASTGQRADAGRTDA